MDEGIRHQRIRPDLRATPAGDPRSARRLKEPGVPRREVQAALESMRKGIEDEAVEDRIPEVLDVVTGFCAIEQTIWND
jgi:hypothetical protein